MKPTSRFWRYLLLPLSFAGMLSISSAAELNPAAVIYKLPDQIPWGPVNAAGAQVAVLVGDPTYLVADASAALKTLRFKPAYSDLATIIRTAWAWHRKAHPLKAAEPLAADTALSPAA